MRKNTFISGRKAQKITVSFEKYEKETDCSCRAFFISRVTLMRKKNDLKKFYKNRLGLKKARGGIF